MHHRYETNSNHSSISSAGHGAFLGTAREKREKLLRKAYLNQQRNGAGGGWQPHSPPPPPFNESYSSEFRQFRYQQNSRTHSVDSISSSNGPTSATVASVPNIDHSMARTSSQTSLNQHRASPCPSDMSFSYSNPKYFVRTAVLRPSATLPMRTPLHYENVIVSHRGLIDVVATDPVFLFSLLCQYNSNHPCLRRDSKAIEIMTNQHFVHQHLDLTTPPITVIQ